MGEDSSQQEVDRSRSRSTTRTASENLLVSLDESVLPPQISKVRPEISPESLGINKGSSSKGQVESAA